MGFSSNERNVKYCLNSLETVLGRQGAPINAGVAVEAARALFEQS